MLTASAKRQAQICTRNAVNPRARALEEAYSADCKRGVLVNHPQTGQEPGLQARQVDVLELIARDLPVDTVLEKICRMAEEFVPGSLAGVTILDRAGITFEGCVMPSAPPFAAALAGIGGGPPHAGTCAAAVHSGLPVSSSDVATDARF